MQPINPILVYTIMTLVVVSVLANSLIPKKCPLYGATQTLKDGSLVLFLAISGSIVLSVFDFGYLYQTLVPSLIAIISIIVFTQNNDDSHGGGANVTA